MYMLIDKNESGIDSVIMLSENFEKVLVEKYKEEQSGVLCDIAFLPMNFTDGRGRLMLVSDIDYCDGQIIPSYRLVVGGLE